MLIYHRNIRLRMRAWSCDRCPNFKKCPYKSALLDLSEERCLTAKCLIHQDSFLFLSING